MTSEDTNEKTMEAKPVETNQEQMEAKPEPMTKQEETSEKTMEAKPEPTKQVETKEEAIETNENMDAKPEPMNMDAKPIQPVENTENMDTKPDAHQSSSSRPLTGEEHRGKNKWVPDPRNPAEVKLRRMLDKKNLRESRRKQRKADERAYRQAQANTM